MDNQKVLAFGRTVKDAGRATASVDPALLALRSLLDRRHRHVDQVREPEPVLRRPRLRVLRGGRP